jgi:hypothetical protein
VGPVAIVVPGIDDGAVSQLEQLPKEALIEGYTAPTREICSDAFTNEEGVPGEDGAVMRIQIPSSV